MSGQKEKATDNRRLTQWRFQWLIEYSISHKLLCYVDSFEFRNPLLRKVANRYQLS